MAKRLRSLAFVSAESIGSIEESSSVRQFAEQKVL